MRVIHIAFFFFFDYNRLNMRFFLLLLLLTGCAVHPPEPPLTQLQVRDIQSHEFDTSDMHLVVKTVMDVLQDEGFIIKNAQLDLGLVNAEKSSDVESNWHRFFGAFAKDPNCRWDKMTNLEASANVSSFGPKIRIRINFQLKTLDNMGCPSKIRSLLDPTIYEDFFSKIDKGLFLKQENL